MHSPRWGVIGRILHRQAAVFLILLGPPLAAAALDSQVALSAALAVPALFAGAVYLTGRRVVIPDDLRRIEAVFSVVAVFLLSCLLPLPAYMVLGLDPLAALFEATSAITTTGFSMLEAPENLPVSGHLLRAWSQWCGGLVIAVAGLAFMMDRGPVARALGIADFGDSEIQSSARMHARALLFAYLGITTVAAGGALILIPGYWEGPALALAAVSTGGMAPRADSLASYTLPAQAFLVLFSALGALSLAFPVLAYRHGLAQAARATSLRSVFRAFAFAIGLYAALHLFAYGFEAAELGRGILNLVSLQSTTGFTVEPVASEAPLLLILTAAMLVGGQTGSTAGGLKIDRVRVLLGLVALVLRRLLSPSNAVTYLRLDGARVDDGRVLFATALLVTYLLAAFALWIIFAAAGEPVFASLFDIVSALSTVGAGTGVIGPDLPTGLKGLTILAMLLGRLEFFGLLVLIWPRTWTRGA